MRTLWHNVSLMRFATDDNNGRIPPMAPIWCALLAAVIWAAWTAAVWAVKN